MSHHHHHHYHYDHQVPTPTPTPRLHQHPDSLTTTTTTTTTTPSNTNSILLEVCVDSLESAKIAIENGANRLEICSNLPFGGGTTPTLGLVKIIQDTFPSIPLMIMIRPRVGSFVYLPSELATMLADIDLFNRLPRPSSAPGGVRGFVFGALTSASEVDRVALTQLLRAASPDMSFTFHRAFDMVFDQQKAYRDIASLEPPVCRILTSAGCKTLASPEALDALSVLASQIASAQGSGSPKLMPGAGVSAENLGQVLGAVYPAWAAATQARADGPQRPDWLGQVHMSGGDFYLPAPEEVGHVATSAQKGGMGFGAGCSSQDEAAEWGRWRVVAEKVRRARQYLDEYASAPERT